MRLDYARLKNVCQHKDLTAEFGPGLNGILGANGKGKSNLLKAIMFAIIGEMFNDGNKVDNISYGETSGFVEIGFTVDTSYVLRRHLDGSKCVLKFNDQEISKSSQVEKFVFALLGTNKHTIMNNIFVRQGQIASIFALVASDCLREFQKTFSLDHLEKTWDLLGQEVNSFRLTAGLKADVDEGVLGVQVARGYLSELAMQLEHVSSTIQSLEPAERLLARVVEAQQLSVAIQAAEVQLGQLDCEVSHELHALHIAQRAQQIAADDYEMVKPAHNGISAKIKGIEDKIVQWSHDERVRAQINELSQTLVPIIGDKALLSEEINSLRDAVSRLKVYDSPNRPLLEDEEALRLKVVEAEHWYQLRAIQQIPHSEELDRIQAEIAKLSNHICDYVDGICPKCKQPAPVSPDEIQRIRGVIAELEIEHRRLLGVLVAERDLAEQQALCDLKVLKAEYASTLVAFNSFVKQELANNGAKLLVAEKALKDVTIASTLYERTSHEIAFMTASLTGAERPVTEELDSLRASLEGMELLKVKLQHAEEALAEVSQRLAVKSQLKASAQQFREHLGKSADIPSEAEIIVAREQVALLSTWRKELADKNREMAVGKALLDQREREAARLLAQYKRESVSARWVELTQQVRSAFHYSALPTMVMQSYAKIINARIQYYTHVLAAPFRLGLNSSMEFMVEFIEGPKQGYKCRAGRLSGGEAVIGAACYRLAISDTFARNMGLLILDEPTNNLDADNRKHLENLLLRLRELSTNTGRQILIVTHDQHFVGFLDNVIQL